MRQKITNKNENKLDSTAERYEHHGKLDELQLIPMILKIRDKEEWRPKS